MGLGQRATATTTAAATRGLLPRRLVETAIKEMASEETAPATIGRMNLGSQGLEVSSQGLGCMGMSAFYGPPKPDADMIALIHHAVNSGVTFLDTSDIYGPHTNEILLGKVATSFNAAVLRVPARSVFV